MDVEEDITVTNISKNRQVLTLLWGTRWNILFPYLSNREIGKFDSALTEKSLRAIYFKKLSKFYLVNQISTVAELEWILKRGVDLTVCRLAFTYHDGNYNHIYLFIYLNLRVFIYTCYTYVGGYNYDDLYARLFIHYPGLIEIKAQYISFAILLIIGAASLTQLQIIDIEIYDDGNDEYYGMSFGQCPNLRSLSIKGLRDAEDEDVEGIIQSCPLLERLHLPQCEELTNGTLQYISRLQSNIKEIDLIYASGITSNVLQKFIKHKCSNLEVFRFGISNGNISDILKCISNTCVKLKILEYHYTGDDEEEEDEVAQPSRTSVLALVRACPLLEEIDIDYNYDDKVLKALGQSCPKLRIFKSDHNSDCAVFTNTGLIALSKGCPELTYLHIADATTITDEAVLSVAQYCHKLTSIYIYQNTNITSTAFSVLLRSNPRVTDIKLRYCSLLNDESIQAIAQYCTNLTTLEINDDYKLLSQGVLTVLSTGCKVLTELTISSTAISDTTITHLASHCTKLTKISLLACSNVTQQSLTSLLEEGDNLLMISMGSCGLKDGDAMKRYYFGLGRQCGPTVMMLREHKGINWIRS